MHASITHLFSVIFDLQHLLDGIAAFRDLEIVQLFSQHNLLTDSLSTIPFQGTFPETPGGCASTETAYVRRELKRLGKVRPRSKLPLINAGRHSPAQQDFSFC